MTEPTFFPQELYWFLILIALSIYVSELLSSWKSTGKYKQHPFVQSPKALTPLFITNALYARNAADLILRGYQKFKSHSFQLLRSNGNIVILPLSVLDELSTLSTAIATPHGALEHDLLGRYTGLDVILENRLHHTIVQRKLTPQLRVLTPVLHRKLAASFEETFPNTDEWAEFQPYQAFCRVAARLSAEAIVGPSFSNNETWLNLSVDYTESLFRTIVILRLFPGWTHSLISKFIPAYWRCQGYIKTAKSLLGPKIQELINKNDEGSWTPSYEDEDLNVLTWLSVLAKGKDRNPGSIAHVQVLLGLAAVHTTVLRMVNVLYDITAAGPTLLKELRDEINAVAGENGWEDIPYDQLHKLDSVLRESQRMSPPTVLGMKRIFKQSHTFQNGLHISEGTYVCMPTYAIENDPEHTPNPEVFDGLRSYRQFMAQDTQDQKSAEKFGFSDTAPTVLNFGYGKTACPGRFFASLTIKMLFVKLLTQYDFKFLPGAERPQNLMAHEFLFTWPWTRMLIKRNHEGRYPSEV
ncbi:cytochrome P450 [Annulohypoxylon maeteangense]|uniref:cytochrome P450 n=1 Tax=Annulohypoxylon maeteangense TaxID=1927788 RepID=UPI002008C1D7|nr:cytochrome P450 [Annulohypoxylon maeteangense]KAI0889802.1 cytochrome P450 [Annulohypoxylon maeteangense]